MLEVPVHVLLFVNWMKKVLLKFKESGLVLNHLFSCPEIVLISLWNCILLELVINILASSADKRG
jgi:hypothetical protein